MPNSGKTRSFETASFIPVTSKCVACGEQFEAAFGTLHNLSVPDSLRYHYDDAYEAASSWEQYDWHFEICLASIVAGIRTYNTHKQAERLAAKENAR